MMLFLENLLDLLLEAAPWLVLGLVLGGLIKALIPTTFLQRHLSGHNFSSVGKAAVLGAPLPLCSCGVIPVALGLRKAGASKPATTSFLVSTPETGIDSITVTYALLGPFMAVVRPIAALSSAFVSGLLVIFFDKEKSSEDNATNAKAAVQNSCCNPEQEKPEVVSTCCSSKAEESKPEATSTCCSSKVSEDKSIKTSSTYSSKAKESQPESSCCASKVAKVEKTSSCCSSEKPEPVKTANEDSKPTAQNSCCSTEVEQPKESSASCCSSEKTTDTQTKTWVQKSFEGVRYSFTNLLDDIIVWLMIGMLFAALANTFLPPDFLAQWGQGIPAMIIMVIAGIPMYICATASTPVAAGLMAAGVSPGVALVLMLTGPATNVSTLGVIQREMGKRTMVLYLIGVMVTAILSGVVVNMIVANWDINITTQMVDHGSASLLLQWASLLLLAGFATRRLFSIAKLLPAKAV